MTVRPVRSFRAVYPSAYRFVSQARHAATEFAMSCGFGLADASDIALAVGEACNNAAEHGHVEQGHFKIGCTFDGHDLAVEVTDSGTGFEHAGKGYLPPEPAIRGLGIFIMRALMDAVTYSFNGKGTTVQLVKHLRDERVPGELEARRA